MLSNWSIAIVTLYDILTYEVMAYDVMTYGGMAYVVITYDIMIYEIFFLLQDVFFTNSRPLCTGPFALLLETFLLFLKI